MTTGGGISYYSNLYGWDLDNVESFEVATARGAIVKASQTEHPDLYWGLRGGGNNLGLVTKFNLYTIPSPKMRGGGRVFSEPNFPAVTRAFIDVVNHASKFQDPIASYGKENKARLQRIAAEYDPTGVYQTLQPGYFKLNGAPADNPYN